jgi:hypothetical protein
MANNEDVFLVLFLSTGCLMKNASTHNFLPDFIEQKNQRYGFSSATRQP